MQIIFSQKAIFDLQEIQFYITKNNPQTSAKTSKIILQNINRLEIFPKLGSFTHNYKNTYKLVVPNLPYLIFYKIDESIIKILSVYHTSRQWPKRF